MYTVQHTEACKPVFLKINPAIVIDEVLEPTRDTLARDEVEGSYVAKAPTEKDVSQDTFKYKGRHFNNKLYHILDCSVQSNVNSNTCIV